MATEWLTREKFTGRTIWSIIWSCLVTIFACTWVAVHPNIPDPDEKWHTVASRRVGITFMALIAPELVIMWAMRQLVSARKLAKQYESEFIISHKFWMDCRSDLVFPEYKWTITHGFFAVMGGFMLFEDGKEPRTLNPFDLEDYVKSGAINITEAEIQDRSRGDILSKGLVIMQTGWFILQCIARRVEHLPITELELVTLAFAALNFVTYGLWWKKPLSVRCPYRVFKDRKLMGEEKEGSQGYGEDKGKAEKVGQEDGGGDKGIWCTFKYIITGIGHSLYQSTVTTVCAVPKIPRAVVIIIRKATTAIGNAILATVEDIRRNGVGKTVINVLWGSLQPFANMMGDHDVVMEKRVSTFYGGVTCGDDEITPIVFAASGIAALFGAIHCIGWSFAFPSHTEKWLWRTSSVAITCLSLAFRPLELTSDWLGNYQGNRVLMKWVTVFGFALSLVTILLSCIIYVLARVTLLILALTSLRSLPAEAYQTVHWTTFIPHI